MQIAMRRNVWYIVLLVLMAGAGGMYWYTSQAEQSIEIGDQHPEDHIEAHSRDDFSAEEKMNIHMCLMGHGEGCAEILDPANTHTYADAIQEQCDFMPGMETCDIYFGISSKTITQPIDLTPQSGAVSLQDPEIVELADGESYEILIQDAKMSIRGREVRMFAYNGSIPGPIIKAPRNATIYLTFTNDIDDITTTTHHHGIRGDNTQDGVPKMMGGFDMPIKKGESITYAVETPDEGVFRYHPHVREDLQQELGLYGNLLIEDDETIANPVNAEYTWVLDDLFVGTEGLVPYDEEISTRVVMGRYGNEPLINGDPRYELELPQGAVTRLYLTNTANVTPFNLTIPGVQMKLVGGDIGNYEREERIDSVVIGPAERYIVEVYTPQPGEYQIYNAIGDESYELGILIVTEDTVTELYAQQFDQLREYTHIQQDIDTYREYLDQPVDKTLVLTVEMDGMSETMESHPHADEANIALPGGLELAYDTVERVDGMPAMNAVSTTDNTRWFLVDQDTGKKSMNIDWSFDLGDIIKIRLINDGNSVHPMQHPFHMHGQRFLVVDKNGQRNDNLVWKDTVLVPKGETVDILVDMSNPGVWMAHCHIAEHMHAGMMLNYTVE